MCKIYYTEYEGRRKYSNLTQKDRIALRNAHNRGKALSKEEKERIFGTNSKFIKLN